MKKLDKKEVKRLEKYWTRMERARKHKANLSLTNKALASNERIQASIDALKEETEAQVNDMILREFCTEYRTDN